MTDADKYITKARADLDEAITKLSEKLADSTGEQKRSPSLTLEGLSGASTGTTNDGALINRLINLSLDDYLGCTKSNKLLTDKVASFLSSLLPLTSVALGLVGKAFDASLMGVPVSAITNGTCFLVDLILKERDRRDLFLAELDRIAYQARRVQEIQRYPDTVLLPLLREKSLNLLTAITWFLAGTIDYFARSLVGRIAKSVFKGAEVWQKSITQLHLACEEYDQALLLQVASTILERSHQPEIPAADDAKVRGWLQPSAAENESKMMANLAQRAEGTLQWVLKMTEFRDWRLADASAKARTLWLTGLPGVGKSCIAAYLCDLLPPQYPDDVVLNFFCKRDTAGLNSATGLVKTLCYQLMRADDFYRRFLQDAPDLPKNNTKDNISFVIDQLLRKPIGAGPKDQTVFILLDGLDELEDSNHGSAGGTTGKTDSEILLEQLVSLPRVKILATSRPLPELDRILSASGTVRRIGPTDNAEDIENYVTHRVAKSVRLRDGFSDVKVDPIGFFTSKANGVFLWVSIVLDVLERAISTRAFQQSLDETHPTMSSIYDDIFKRAEQRGSLQLIMEVVNWAVILPSPFTIQQMALAVELSLGDRALKMEEFLRTECGAFLNLVPRLGSTKDASTEQCLEIHIGHETFQAWLADRMGREGRLTAHAKAATACLKYLLGRHSDQCLMSYALERWRWHVRHSMGVGDRRFAEPLSVLVAGFPIPAPDIAADLFLNLCLFLSQPAAESWIKKQVENENYDHRVFWEVHHTCIEIAAWCKVNKDGITNQFLENLCVEAAELSRLKSWRDTIDNPQVIAQMLWPSVCHAWLWSTSARWWGVYWCVEVLHQLYIYAHGEGLFEERQETTDLLKEESRILEANAKSTGIITSGRLHGTLTIHFANVMIRAKALKEGDPDAAAAYSCLESVKTAGRFDDLSGICAANVSMFFYEMWKQNRVHPSEKPLQNALETIQEAIDDDPDDYPRNYYHLGKIYGSMGYEATGDTKQAFKQKSLEAYRAAVARDPEHLTDARQEVYQAEEDALRAQDPPALDAAVELLERAIVDDPENSRNRWYHHLFDVHKERGDLAASRNTYRRLIAFDPSWHTKWHKIADTWIDDRLYQEERTFDWRNWCDALLEAVDQDPSYAHSYWRSWQEKANSLSDYGHFDISIDILRYGADRSASRSDSSSRDACAVFYFRLGETLGKRGDWKEAISQLEEAFTRADRLDIWRQRNTLEWLAWAYMAEARWDDAAAVAEKRLAMSPDKVWGDPLRHTAHGWMGEIALYQHKFAVAVKEFKTAIRMEDKVLAEDAKGDPKKMLSEGMAHYLLDLGITYDQMGKSTQAVAVFKKALPHVEHVLHKKMELREMNDGLWRREGRCHMLLAWTLERQSADGISNPKVLDEYKLAEWVFHRTVYLEDDFVEFGDIAAAEAAIKRVQSGQLFTYPDDETFLKERMRLKIGSTRADWANSNYKDEVQKPRKRGRG